MSNSNHKKNSNIEKISVKEKMHFFPGSKKRSLFAFLHQPDSNLSKTGILYCHPFAAEQNASHFAIARAARQIATRGFPVLRFDLSGCGDSEGELEEITLSDWLKDIESAVNLLKQETGIEKYILWGLRFGAGLALLHMADNKEDISSIILWQPVVNFKEHMLHFLFRKLASDSNKKSVADIVNILIKRGILYVNGYPITKQIYNDFITTDSKPSSYIPECPMFLLSISSSDRIPFQLKHYISKLDKMKCIFNFEHIVSEPFWDRYLQRECNDAVEATIRWINSVVSGE